MLPFFVFLDYYGQFRVEIADEIAGLDHSFHGGVEDALNERTHEAVAAIEKRLLQQRQGGFWFLCTTNCAKRVSRCIVRCKVVNQRRLE